MWRYSNAALIMGIALAARHLASPLLGYEAPYVFFTVAALLATWLAGVVPGLAVMVAGFFCGDYSFTPPLHNFGPYSLKEQAYIADFVLCSSVGIALIATLRRSERQLGKTARELAMEVDVRKQTERELTFARQRLEARVADTTVSLRQSVASMEELLYSMVHNLRAPSRAMEGFAQIISETCRANIDPSACQLLDRLSGAARRNDSLIRDLLEYGRASHVELKPRELSCKKLLVRVMNDLDAEIAASGAHVVLERGLEDFVADETAMLIVFRELIGNALKFRSADRVPIVRVYTRRRDETVQVCVEDNGLGIEEAYLAKIYRPFEKIAGETEGNGIGLAIVSKLVERLGGTINVRSRLGEGTTFILELVAAQTVEKPFEPEKVLLGACE